ncbi:hypothetical protein [Edaphobacter aggregans]|nr:hypothetical protein [Edaphobacter aggregans]
MAWWPELMQKTAARYDSIVGTKRPRKTLYVSFPEQCGYIEPACTERRVYIETIRRNPFPTTMSPGCPITKSGYSEPIEDSEDAPEQSWLDTGDGRGNSLEAIQYRRNKDGIEKAYANFIDPFVTENNAHEIAGEYLLDCVIDFAKKKIKGAIHGLPDAFKDEDDYSQIVAMKVCNGLNKFVGGPGDFCAWLTTICHTVGCDAKREINANYAGMVPFLVETEFGEEEEHPDVIRQYIHDEERHHPASRYVQPPDLKTVEKLPDWVTGTNRLIANQLQAGSNCAEIAKGLGMNPATVRKRVERMRVKLKWLPSA